MQKPSIEPARVMRTAAWMWASYLIAMAVMDLFLYANRPILPIVWYHLINWLPALVFLGLAYSRWMKERPAPLTALMILLISIGPVLLNHLYDLHLPPAPLSNIEGMVLRQLPVLFIGLVLVAWNYNLLTMILYSVAMNLFELVAVNLIGSYVFEQQTVFYYVTVIRTISFIVVGIFINLLIRRLRTQQESLQAANQQLSHYASTLENLTISRERNRMSRELHDTVVHTLSGLSVQLETAKAYLKIEPETAAKLIDQSLEQTRSGLHETRRAIKDLRATPLDDLGLVRAIQSLADAASQRKEVSVTLSLPEEDPILSPDVEQCIYRISQEAMENIVHHANAHKILIRLAVQDRDTELIIQDDGIGFDPQASLPDGHFGLPGMRERAQLTGGELTITSQADQGTTIRLLIKGCIE